MDLAGERSDLLHNAVSLEIRLVVVVRQFAADLVFSLRRYQQNRPLHGRKTRQDQVQQDERIPIEPDVSIADHPAGEEHHRAEHKAPRTHAIAELVCRPLASGEVLARLHPRVVVPTREPEPERLSNIHAEQSS